MTVVASQAIKYLLNGGLGSAAPPAYSAGNSDTTVLTDGSTGDTGTFVTGNTSGSVIAYFKFPAGTFSVGETLATLLELEFSSGNASSTWNSIYVWASTDGSTWGAYPIASNTTGGNSGSGQAVSVGPSATGNSVASVSAFQYIAVVANAAASNALKLSDVRITGNTSGNTLGAVMVDTTAPVVAGVSINANGTSGTINWTETGTPPVLQAAGFGTSQGLTLTGLNGGAVTVSNVATTGTTTTFSLSRVVRQTETGGLLGIAAGAFTDSAQAPNATAAVASQAVTNNSTQTAPLVLPGGPMPLENPTTNVGFSSKIGIAVEPQAGSLVQASRLLHRVSGSLLSDLALLEMQTIRNHPGSPGVVRGVSKIGGGLVLEVTPESDDELLSSFFGAPATTGVSGPAAPAAPTAAVVGAAGAATLSYTLIARSAQGDSAASTAATVTTANAALSGTNYVQLSWAAVPGATSYVVLKGGAVLGVVYGLSLQDAGQATQGAYAAPAATSGNVQTWKNGFAMLPVSLLEQKGATVAAFGGCQGNKLSIKYDKAQSTPFQITAEMMALYEILGYTPGQLGLTTAGFDPLGDYGVAPSTVAYFAGAPADCQSFEADLDNNLGEKQALTGYLGPNGFFKQENKGHSLKANLYFSSEAEYQRYFGQAVGTPTGPYGAQKPVNYFPISIVTTNPVNAGGIVNQFILFLPNAAYRKVGAAIKDKGAIMQEVEIGAYIDPVTGTDILISVVNSRSNSSIVSPGQLVTVPANAQFPYTA